MANKFTYSHPANEVVQVATMEKPTPLFNNPNAVSIYNRELADYQKHISALARYPCQGFGPEDDGKEFEEGVGLEYVYYRDGVAGIREVSKFIYDASPDYLKSGIIAVRIPDKGDVGEIHELKIWPEYFDDVDSGKKPFEVRKTDRLFGVGDTLHLREWSLNTGYSGRETRKIITYILHGGQWGLQEGNCILGLQQPAPAFPAEFVEWVSDSGWFFVPAMNYWKNYINTKHCTTAELYNGPYQQFLQSKK